jgi:hypothetical protein
MHPQCNSKPDARDVAGGAWARADQVQWALVAEANDPMQFARARQNIAAVAMLLRNPLEPTDPQQQELHRNIRTLVERDAVQQAEI